MELTIVMDEERYNNRQVERMLDNQTGDLKEHLNRALAPILEQTTKTNGRVSVLEKRADSMSGAIGLAAWIGIPLISVIVTITSWMIMQVVSIPIIVQHAVSEALLPYTK